MSLMTVLLVRYRRFASCAVLTHEKYAFQGNNYWVEITGIILTRCTSSLDDCEALFHESDHPVYINSMLSM